MFVQNLKSMLATGVVASTLVASAIAAVPANAAVTDDCSWTGSRIACRYGAAMSNQGRSGDFASAEARYAGGVRYLVGCKISTNVCQWQRF